MDINIYEDFYQKQKLSFDWQKAEISLLLSSLNAMGIPFKRNANGILLYAEIMTK